MPDYAFISFSNPERTIQVGSPLTTTGDGVTPLILCKRITRAQQSIFIYADDDFGEEFKFMEIHISQVNFLMPPIPPRTTIATNHRIGNRFFGRTHEDKNLEEWFVTQRDANGFVMRNATGDVIHSDEFTTLRIVESETPENLNG